jgi:hypothetical protein
MSDVAFLSDPWYQEQRSNNSFSIAAFGHRRYSEHGFHSGTLAIFYTNNHRKHKYVPREEVWMNVGYRPGRAAVCFRLLPQTEVHHADSSSGVRVRCRLPAQTLQSAIPPLSSTTLKQPLDFPARLSSWREIIAEIESSWYFIPSGPLCVRQVHCVQLACEL